MLNILLTMILFMAVLGSCGLIASRWVGIGTIGTWVYAGSTVICGINATVAVVFLMYGKGSEEAIVPLGLPWFPTHLCLDGLAAIFLFIVNAGGVSSALYGLGHSQDSTDPIWVLFSFPLFLAGMTLVPLSDDIFSFLLSWEFMSITSWCMVLTSHQQCEARRAAAIYLVMAVLGTTAITLSFGILATTSGSYSFAAIRACHLSPLATSLAVAFVLIGAGSKAGMVPLHVWLPLAHPAAPTHVSALMSGVMTKVAIYALIRLLFDLLGTVGWEWGLIVLIIGGFTAVLGVLYAILQRDIKTILAYSTVENVGVILTAIGLAVAFRANGHEALAGLSLVAALFHIINHSFYKSLLFLSTGIIVTATSHRDLEQLGGLIHRLPVTATAFLVGCMAVAALPPLNGFVSEWLLFQAMLSGPRLPEWTLKLAVPVVGAMLALATALASACFVRVFGIAFLGRPRSTEAALATETTWLKRRSLYMYIPLIILSAVCLSLGTVPTVVLHILVPVVKTLLDASPLPDSGIQFLWLEPTMERSSSYGGLVLLIAIMSIAGFTVLIMRQLTSSRRFNRSHAWDCGYPETNPLTQYSASSFSQPLRRMFASAIFCAYEEVETPEPGDISAARFRAHMRDPIWYWLYHPVKTIITWSVDKSYIVQFMTIREYLVVLFMALVTLLIVIVVS